MAVLTRLRLSAKLENLGRFTGALSDCARAQGFGQEKIGKIELAAEEALVNVIRYAYPEQPGDVEMICRWEGEGLAIEIIDSGVPFDAAAAPVREVADGDHEREPGGLGILLMKKVTDEVRYRREEDRNILTLIIRKD